MFVVVAVLINACSAGSTATGSSASGESDSTASSGASEPEPSVDVFDPDEPTLPGGVRVLSQDTDGFVAVDAGRYGVRVSDSLLYQVDLLADSEVVGGVNLNPRYQGGIRDVIVWIDAADESTAIPVHPCEDHTGKVPGPTVEDLARALGDQPFLQVTQPVRVTVGGKSGLFVKATVPQDARLLDCEDGQVITLVASSGAEDGGIQEPGGVDRMWILDVDGLRHVIHAVTLPGAHQALDKRAVTEMVESITFTHG